MVHASILFPPRRSYPVTAPKSSRSQTGFRNRWFSVGIVASKSRSYTKAHSTAGTGRANRVASCSQSKTRQRTVSKNSGEG